MSFMPRSVSRSCLAVALALLVAASMAATEALARAAAADRPNILYIMTDQQHAGMMSCTGNSYVKTPAMDRLAANGARFERAYCANPVCLPSRVGIMTGHFPSHFGIRSNDSSTDTMPQDVVQRGMGWIFRNAGYETAYGGKTHWLRGMSPKTLGFENLTGNDRDELADACAGFLRAKHDKPFLLVASFINPHDICFMALNAYTLATQSEEAYGRETAARKCLAAAMQLPAGVSRDEFLRTLCPPLPANYGIPALEPKCIDTKFADGRPFREFVRTHWTDEDWRLHRWAYSRLTEMVDAQIAKVLDALREAGLAERTLVVFSSDHGDMDASHRLEHKAVLYEEAVRVPFIVSYLGVTKPGQVDTTHFVSSGVDLIPTLCDYAGIAPPQGLPGRSVRALADGRQPDAWPDQIVVESQAGRMLRTDRYKYAVYESGAHREQLTDLAHDPGEMTNLAEDPAHRDVLNDLRARLHRWVNAYGDKIGQQYVLESQ